MTVTNSQKAIPIDTDEVTRQAKLLLEILNVRDFEVQTHYYLLFSSNAIIADLLLFVFHLLVGHSVLHGS